jgi:DNA-binding response OmpR family regulator
VVEADVQVGRGIADQLVADGYAVELARGLEHARILADLHPPRLAVIGQLDGPRGALALLEEIRGCTPSGAPWEPGLPAIVVGHRAREIDVLRAFEVGADDFVVPPASYLELRARLRAVLRRTVAAHADPVQVGSLTIDARTHLVVVDGRRVALRRLEFQLLDVLAGEPERVFARRELLRDVWGFRSSGSTRTVDSHASRLRHKLAPDAPHRWVVGVRGIGYRLR